MHLEPLTLKVVICISSPNKFSSVHRKVVCEYSDVRCDVHASGPPQVLHEFPTSFIPRKQSEFHHECFFLRQQIQSGQLNSLFHTHTMCCLNLLQSVEFMLRRSILLALSMRFHSFPYRITRTCLLLCQQSSQHSVYFEHNANDSASASAM